MSGKKKSTMSLPSSSGTNNIEKPNGQNEAEGDGGALQLMDVKPIIKEPDEFISLRIITSDMNNEANFRIKNDTPLVRLKRSYSGKMGFETNELRFVFDGHRITDYETPRKLGMVNDDTVEVYQERFGGGM